MTQENGVVVDLVGERVEVGQRVRVKRSLPREVRYNGNEVMDLDPSEPFMITRVYTNRVIIRTIRTFRSPDYWATESQWSFSVSREDVIFDDENYVPPPPPRKLGEKPEDTEDQEYLDISDPRIQWMWDDLGRYADGKAWCPQYDQLCKDIGVPGRPQDFHVTRTLNGVQIRATIKARSQAEANQLFTHAMSTAEKEEGMNVH